MNRKQKRAKRMKARAAQQAHRQPRIRTYADGSQIEVTGGPRARASSHSTDRMRHGERLDARGLAVKHLAELGVTDPNDDIVREFQRLVKRAGGNVALAKQRLERNLKDVLEKANAAAQKAIEPLHPTDQQWDEITATAKRRKRGIKKFAAAAGFQLLDDHDPKQRTSWVRTS